MHLCVYVCVYLWIACLVRRAHGCLCVCVCLYFDVLISSSLSMVRSFPAYLRKKKKKAYISSQLAGIFLVISMALSSVFRKINVKDLTSKVSDYTSATGDDFGSLP